MKHTTQNHLTQEGWVVRLFTHYLLSVTEEPARPAEHVNSPALLATLCVLQRKPQAKRWRQRHLGVGHSTRPKRYGWAFVCYSLPFPLYVHSLSSPFMTSIVFSSQLISSVNSPLIYNFRVNFTIPIRLSYFSFQYLVTVLFWKSYWVLIISKLLTASTPAAILAWTF